MALGCGGDLGVEQDDLLALGVGTLLALALLTAHSLFSRIPLFVELLALGHGLLKLLVDLLDGDVGLRDDETALDSGRRGQNLGHLERDFKFDGSLVVHL